MKEIISSPIFGIVLSLGAFELSLILYKKTKLAIFNPLFISIMLVIGFLKITGISLEDYNKGGAYISFFLSPATVILAVPLYKKISLLKKNFMPIMASTFIGSTLGILLIVGLCRFFSLPNNIVLSMVPKSVTVPIGMEVSRQIGGIPAVTVAAIIMTGIMGAVVGPFFCKIFRIKDKVAVGIAMGTASHAVGTTKAMELGETEGAMSSLAIGIAGLMVVFIAPIIVKILF